MRRFARGEVIDERPMPYINSESVGFLAAFESLAAIRRLTCMICRPTAPDRMPGTHGIAGRGNILLQYLPAAWI